MPVLGLSVLAAASTLSEDWKVVAGAFLGTFAAHLVNTGSLRRLVKRAIAEHMREAHGPAKA